ncbi:MAG: FkbM family methyltransferase [Nitrospirales bacterium]
MLKAVRDAVRSLIGKFGYDIVNLRKDENTSRFLPQHLRRQFAKLGINCVIDVGANCGQYASMLRDVGYCGRIVSIEPLPELCAGLQECAATDPEWRIINMALGEREEVLPFNVLNATDLSSLLAPKQDIGRIVPRSEVAKVIDVQVTTLDKLLPQVIAGLPEPRIFLKMDTQGYDLHVVRGGLQSLKRICLIQSELSIIPLYEAMPNYVQALQTFNECGFIPSGFFSVYKEVETGLNVEYDVVLTRRAPSDSM